MKKLLVIMTFPCLLLFSCGSSKTEQAEKEKQDSIAAAAQADSMLRAEVAADSLKTDSAKKDSAKGK
jgi:hypothetical protein